MSTSLGAIMPTALIERLRVPAAARDDTVLVSTVDEGGFPRTALLSRSEVHVPGPDRLRIAIWGTGSTSANLQSGAPCTLAIVVGDAFYSMIARVLGRAPLNSDADPPILAVEMQVVDVRLDRVPYASVLSGVEYELHDPSPVLERWNNLSDQLAALEPSAIEMGEE